MKRLRTGQGIRVRTDLGDGEIVRVYIHHRSKRKEYEIRLGPAHFIYLPRTEFELLDTIIPFKTLIELERTGP